MGLRDARSAGMATGRCTPGRAAWLPLSHYAETVRGWRLFRSEAEIGMLLDGKDQYHSLVHAKNEFYRELNKDGRWFDMSR
jgi:hypothetical protein